MTRNEITTASPSRPAEGRYEDEYDLEHAVLLESIAAVDIGRQRCSCCGRTPLVGEYVYRLADGTADCESCRMARRDAPPAAIEQVRNAGGRLTVQAAGPVPELWPDVAAG